MARSTAGSEPPRRILMLARQFPPIGGAGVHRSVGTVRHLPEHGYEPIVVTGPGARADRWSPHDPALMDRIPARTEIHRLPGPEPVDSQTRADRWLARPAPSTRWWLDGAVRVGGEAGRGVAAVYASCIPYETATAGARLAAILGVPWIADIEDPWALDEMRVHATAAHRRLDLARMRRALAGAAAIVTCAPETAARVRALGLPGRVAAIPIGYDGADFAGGDPGSAGSVDRADGDGRAPGFRIVHTGSLHTALGQDHRRSRTARRLLGGSAVNVDILTRSHLVLLDALDRVLAAEPGLRGGVEVVLAGGLTDADRAAIAGRAYVRAPGQLGHADTLALMRSADLLFLPLHDVPRGERVAIIPYKTYEYLAARRPILAAVPDGDVRDLLTPLTDATVCRPGDVAGIAAALSRLIAAGRVTDVAHRLDAEPLLGLERGRLVARIAAELDAVLD